MPDWGLTLYTLKVQRVTERASDTSMPWLIMVFCPVGWHKVLDPIDKGFLNIVYCADVRYHHKHPEQVCGSWGWVYYSQQHTCCSSRPLPCSGLLLPRVLGIAPPTLEKGLAMKCVSSHARASLPKAVVDDDDEVRTASGLSSQMALSSQKERLQHPHMQSCCYKERSLT